MVRRGRAPCCDKSKVKKGPWSPAEDSRLISFIHKHGHGNWRALPKQAGLSRCGKSCRLRWINYLRPDVKRGNFSPEEEESIINLHHSMGNKWSKIASHLPGRTDNEIKNVWNTHLKKKKKLMMMINTKNIDADATKDSLTTYNSASPSSSSCISYGDLNLDKEPQEGQESNNTSHDQPQEYYPLSTLVISSGHYCNSSLIHEAKYEESLLLPTHSINDALDNAQKKSMISSVNNCNAASAASCMNDEETSKERAVAVAAADHEIIEIPFEYCDIDFWNMFDDTSSSFDPKESNIVSQQVQQQQEQEEVSQSHEEEEGEYKKWLRYLENELGLVGGTSSDTDLPVH